MYAGNSVGSTGRVNGSTFETLLSLLRACFNSVHSWSTLNNLIARDLESKMRINEIMNFKSSLKNKINFLDIYNYYLLTLCPYFQLSWLERTLDIPNLQLEMTQAGYIWGGIRGDMFHNIWPRLLYDKSSNNSHFVHPEILHQYLGTSQYKVIQYIFKNFNWSAINEIIE